jgi:hypothetical protein
VLAASRSNFEPENAIAGLRLLAVQHPREVCSVLLNAQKVPGVIHDIRKRSVTELASDLQCANPQH